MKLRAVLLSVAPATLIASSPVTGHAAAPKRDGEGIHEGGYIYGSPGVVAVPLDDDDFFDLDTTWQWSFGGGYHLQRGAFGASLGAAFEHTILNLDDFSFDALNGHNLRILPEVRLGGGNRRVWGYGLFGVGLGLVTLDARTNTFGGDDNETLAGAVVQVGGGVQAAVWRSLFLGGELDLDLGFYDDEQPAFPRDFEVHHMGVKFVIGWIF